MAVIISSQTAREKYPVVRGIKTPGGSPVRDCADKVAVALRGTGMDDWFAIAEQNGVKENLTKLQEMGKNPGQIRMALGRMLRAIDTRYAADPDKNPAVVLPVPIVAAPPKLEEPGEESEGEEELEEDENSEEDEEELA